MMTPFKKRTANLENFCLENGVEGNVLRFLPEEKPVVHHPENEIVESRHKLVRFLQVYVFRQMLFHRPLESRIVLQLQLDIDIVVPGDQILLPHRRDLRSAVEKILYAFLPA